jgi:hypothetical protein
MLFIPSRMRIQISVIAIGLEFVIVDAFPQRPPPPYYAIPNARGFLPFSPFLSRIFIDPTCSEGQKIILQQAWDKAKLLAQAQTGNLQDYDYNTVHQFYLGDDWNAPGTPDDPLPRYRSRAIVNNFNRLKKLFNGEVATDEYIYWYCEDSQSRCSSIQGSGVTSNSREGWSTFKNSHTTIWCPDFFNIAPLKQQTDLYFFDARNQTIIDNFDKNCGTVMLHEIWKYEHLVCDPRTNQDKLFIQENRAEQIWELARLSGTRSAYITADSYTMDALAVYLQQLFSSTIPALPTSVWTRWWAEA